MHQIENASWHLLVGHILDKNQMVQAPKGARYLAGQLLQQAIEWHPEDPPDFTQQEDRAATAQKLMESDEEPGSAALPSFYLLSSIEKLWLSGFLQHVETEQEAIDIIKLFLFVGEKLIAWIPDGQFLEEHRKKFSALRATLLSHYKEERANGTQ